MRKLSKLVAIILIASILSGCYTMKVEAPSGVKLTLSSETTAGTYKAQKKVWYVLWGIVPISNNSSAPMIQGKDLKEVKAKTYMDITDCLITILLNIFPTTLATMTMEIEGK